MLELKERRMLTVVDVEPRNARELTLGRLIDASAEALFRCWMEPALLVQWFAPKPNTTEVLEHDFRPGGRQQLLMRGPNGEEYPTGGVFLEIAPNRRIVFTDAFRDAWIPGDGTPFMLGEVSFEPQTDGRTLYVARVGHWTDEAKAQHEARGFREGWGIVAEQLAEVARGL